MLPSKTLTSKKASSPGYRKSKEYITVSNCCNASGAKFKPTLIGKSNKFRTFKNVNTRDFLCMTETGKVRGGMQNFLRSGFIRILYLKWKTFR